nr:flagellar biosynthetic protein FliR [Paracoccus aestuariivivens]
MLNDPKLASTLSGLILVYCRVQACLLSLPGFSTPGLPVRVRVAIAMSMTPLLAEQITAVQLFTVPVWFAFACLAELMTGLAIGAMVRLFASALDIAAAAIAATASLSQLVGPATEHTPHPVGNIFHLAGIAVLMALGFPFAVIDLLQSSLAVKPVGEWPDISALFPAAIGLFYHGFKLGLMLAAPFILGGFLFQLLSGMVNKVMPAFPVTFIAAPGAVLLALIALALLTPSTISIWASEMFEIIRVMHR